MSAENSKKVRNSSELNPLRAPPVRQGKLMEALSAGRDCPGPGAGPLAAMAWTARPPRQDILRFACPYFFEPSDLLKISAR